MVKYDWRAMGSCPAGVPVLPDYAEPKGEHAEEFEPTKLSEVEAFGVSGTAPVAAGAPRQIYCRVNHPTYLYGLSDDNSKVMTNSLVDGSWKSDGFDVKTFEFLMNEKQLIPWKGELK